ncbi:ethanolamine ammonia-lyase subunit EutC|uniref:Ethanolamine ammonia-lyase small subunit n=1 Tax=Dendrosporobacter quercicolus TaxID=146817 RepID=A0A1G9WBQ8_9FIRM|nr:ethanolamine ammonia-lyase subunit EutC [Dendrosporobacter quercicolus]NSL47666.1 ethanolamine ammonia-lyase subunit EutC [Dendrosporobacter quercicolus DSM 1736]SDM81651.1 Ethanolamine ammonia-lyase light chain [Dendrosporobacter quercicolus]
MGEYFIPDIAGIDYTSRIAVGQARDPESCIRLRKSTNARICVGRAGDRLRTETLLRFRADHAVAMDAVWSDVDETLIEKLGFYQVQTLVEDKEQYITRPDLGRIFSADTIRAIKQRCIDRPVVQILVADGLSSPAINANLADIYPIIVDGVTAGGYKLGTPVFIKYGRVATMDQISDALKAKVTVLLVGERPGLATGESMSCYMAYESSPLKPESQRNVISNIHRKGIPPVEAGAQIVQLIEILLQAKNSGVTLKL